MDASERLRIAEKALQSLEAIPLPPRSEIERDAAIQRFEYTFEALWKAAAAVLLQGYGVRLASPKPVIRACRENHLLSDEEAALALAMADARNLTSHTYHPAIAEAIAEKIPLYRLLMRRWLEQLTQSSTLS